jgi:hypothetical protein
MRYYYVVFFDQSNIINFLINEINGAFLLSLTGS